MKTKKLLLAALFFLPLVSSAQPYNSANLKTGMEQHTIVRNWNNRYVVTHISDNNGARFSCSNVSGFLGTFSSSGFTANAYYSDPLPLGYSINDLRVLNDTAYFCGTYKISSNPDKYIGIVGYFDLNAFLSLVFNPVVLKLSDINQLRRLTAFRTDRGINVVAIGNDTLNPTNNIFVEIQNATSGTPNCTLHTVSFSINQEYLDDVIFTKNNIILVGTILQGPTTRLIVRKLDYPSDLAMSSHYGYYYIFYSASDEINARIQSVLLDDDEIVVSYVKVKDSPLTFWKRIRVIDTYLPNPKNVHSQEFEIGNKMETMEMAYSRTEEKLVLLQEPLINNSNFYYLLPHAVAPYVTNITYFLHNKPYCSIDTYSANNTIAVGMDHAYMQFIPTQTNLGCPNNVTVDVMIIPDLLGDWIPTGPSRSMTFPTSQSFNLSSYPTSWGTSCCTH